MDKRHRKVRFNLGSGEAKNLIHVTKSSKDLKMDITGLLLK